MDNYVWTHLHTMYSNGVTNIDSITDYTEYIDYAKKLGMKAICFTEHGNVFSWLHKKEYAEKQGLKYIHGIEAYITETLDEKIRDNYHCVLIAKNYDGVKEINQLSSISFDREDNHFYYMPRITFDELKNTSDNIFITTACLGGILHNGNADIKDDFVSFLIANKHRCFLEIQHHNVPEQIEYNKYLYELHKSTGLPLIAGTDTHALNDSHMEGRAILQIAKDVHFSEEEKWDLTAKSLDELIAAYKTQNSLPMNVVMDAINNTNVIAEQVEEFVVDRSYKYPHLWEDPESEIWAKIRMGVVRRGIEDYPNYGDYLERIDYEMETYKHNGAIDFMLLMTDILDWCRENDIGIGYGRGSVNGSVIAWLLGITEMDSIKHNLNFERFLNQERVSLSDIDTDFPPSDIEKVKQYLYERHGLYCSDIITFNTISDKGAIRDVGRALDMSLDEVSNICNTVDNPARYATARKKYQKLFKYVDLVKGTIVSIGSHPCGTIVADAEISDVIGTCTTKTSSYRISQINMKEVDSLNYVKLDLLKLDTIELINNTCKLANIERVTPDNINVEDDRVWDAMRKDTTSIFQWEQSSGSDYIKKLMNPETLNNFRAYNPKLDRMTLFSIGNSAIRPAGASYREDLAQGKVRLTGCKPIDDFLKPTFGYLVFQEQIISFLHEYCGFTMGQADVVRRCVDENTLITMATGDTKKIKNIKVGDEVQCFTENGFATTSTVTNVFDNGEKDVVKITTNNDYTILATKEHKVLTQNGWKQVGELTETDYLMAPSFTCRHIDGLRPNQRLSGDDLALLGLLLGDGCMCGDPSSISFVNSDVALIDRFKECVANRLRHHDKNDCEFYVDKVDGKTVDKIYSIKIKTKAYKMSVYNLIKKYNMDKQSADKFIPDEIIKYPADEKIKMLLGGLFSTDGGFLNNTNAIEYSSISERLAHNIKQLLLKFGIYSYTYKSYVKAYDYYCYKVRVSQRDALLKFKEFVLPYVIGNKKTRYLDIINRNSDILSYNYILPNEYVNEIKSASVESGISFNSIGIDVKNNTVTDTKAKAIAQDLYCPKTYQMLMAQYEPMRIKKIEHFGVSHVYDISVDKYHNYIANGVIVHNCFAKKTGTEEWLPIIKNGGYPVGGGKNFIKGYIATMKERYGIPEEKSEEDITAFIQVIEDASNYLFSLNHSQPYSYEGYASGWLREYYPLEFLTAALNINRDNGDKTRQLTQYASRRGIRVVSPKFRYSRADYFCDKEQNKIYKGIGSIKQIGSNVADSLYGLKDKKYDSFTELLYDILGKVNTRQRDVLIKIGFFQEFGDINYLLEVAKLFDAWAGRKTIKATEAEAAGIPKSVMVVNCEKFTEDRVKEFDYKRYIADNGIEINLGKYTGRTGKINSLRIMRDLNVSEDVSFDYATKITAGAYSGVNIRNILKEYEKLVEIEPCSFNQMITYQLENLGYIDYVNPRINRNYVVVTDLDTKYSPKFKAYRLCDGKVCAFKAHGKSSRNKSHTLMKNHPFADGDILRMCKYSMKPKMKKVDGEWVKDPTSRDVWLDQYVVIKDFDYEMKIGVAYA